jgi:hypothetical protein
VADYNELLMMSMVHTRVYTIFTINIIKMWVRNILLVRVNNYYCPFYYSICVTTVITENSKCEERQLLKEGRIWKTSNIVQMADGFCE